MLKSVATQAAKRVFNQMFKSLAEAEKVIANTKRTLANITIPWEFAIFNSCAIEYTNELFNRLTGEDNIDKKGITAPNVISSEIPLINITINKSINCHCLLSGKYIHKDLMRKNVEPEISE